MRTLTLLSLLSAMAYSGLDAEVKKINPAVGQSTWLICKKMGDLSDETTATPVYNASHIGGMITLGSSGNYFAAENLVYPLTIATDGVYFNLNGYTISHSNAVEDVITVASNLSDVTINNGYITNTGGAFGGGSGIFISAGASMISVADLTIFGCGAGVKMGGSFLSPVSACELQGLELTGNSTAVRLEYAYDNTLQECNAIGSLYSGFWLGSSNNNSLLNCRALKTISPQSAMAFFSDSGEGNIFQECVAKQTISTAEVFGYKSYGFVLTGTENKTKLIDCIVNETTLSETGSSTPYGIRIAPSFLVDSHLLEQVAFTTVGQGVLSVSWAPDSQHLAYCDDHKGLYVSFFDGTDIVSVATTVMATATINYVDWSPDGNYIVTGDGDDYVRVFKIVGTSLVQVSAQLLPNLRAVLGVAWSPNGKYIACGDDFSNVHIYSFNGLTLTHEAENATPGDEVNRVAWAPDSQYIASGSAFSSGVNSVNVFKLVGVSGALQLNHIDGDNLAAGAVNSIAWSSNSRYITCGDSAGDVIIYNFDGAVLNMVNVNGDLVASLMRGVVWSPDGDYVVSCDDQGFLRVWSLDLTSTTSFVTSPGAYTDLSWTPDGQFIATSEHSTPVVNGVVRIYNIMHSPANCLIDSCKVCDTTGFDFLTGLGISGSSKNFFLRNIAANNDINYSANITNVFDKRSTVARIAEPFDNISI